MEKLMEKNIQYYILFGIAQASAIVAIILLINILSSSEHMYFSWDETRRITFHVLFMVLSLVYCQGTSISLYRVMSGINRPIVKTAHAVLHCVTFVFMVVGLHAVFTWNSFNDRPHMRSIHSWIGLLTSIMFSAQWFFSLLLYMYPKGSENLRESIMPLHRKMGLLLVALSVSTALMGINGVESSMLLGLITDNYTQVIWIGLLLAIFGILTVMSVGSRYFKRDNLCD